MRFRAHFFMTKGWNRCYFLDLALVLALILAFAFVLDLVVGLALTLVWAFALALALVLAEDFFDLGRESKSFLAAILIK